MSKYQLGQVLDMGDGDVAKVIGIYNKTRGSYTLYFLEYTEGSYIGWQVGAYQHQLDAATRKD